MALLRIRNTLADTAEKTSLSFGENSGVTSLRVKNISSARESWALQIGATGVEQTELRLITAATPSGTALSVTAATSYEHPTDTPLYFVKYDQVVIKRSTAGTAGTASNYATVTITPDSVFTTYDDTTGASTYAYKALFKNSVSGDITGDSDWITPSGYSPYALSSMRQRVKNKLFSADFIKEDVVIDDWFNEWVELMNNAAVDVNEDYSLGTASVSFGTSSFGALGTITASDFKDVRRVWFTSNGTDYNVAKRKEIIDYTPTQNFDDTAPYYFHFGDNILGKLPATAGTAQLVYYKLPVKLVNEGDELPYSMRGYSKSFVDYALAQAYYLDKEDTKGDRFKEEAYSQLERFRNDIASRQKSGVKFIDATESLDADDFYEYL